MPKISAAAAAQRRARILDAARHCFGEHGIHVSVDEICARAGISKGGFYGYFDSKDAAIQALAQDHEHVVGSFATMDRVESLIERLTEFTAMRSTASNRLEVESWAHALKNPPLRNAMQHNLDTLRQALATALSNLSRGAKPPLSPAVASEIVALFAMGVIASSALGAEKGTRAAHALKALIAVLLHPAAAGGSTIHARAPTARMSKRL